MGETKRDAWNAGNWDEAIRAARADITQYTIWHKSHTAPGIERDIAGAARLLATDLMALSSQVADLCILYHRAGRSSELPAVLERLRSNVRSPLWDRKITHHQALVAHQLDDDVKARIEFDKLLPIEPNEPDSEIIQLYISLYGGTLTFSQVVALCDRVLQLTTSVEDKLQYAGLKGFMYMTVGDDMAARSAFAQAVASGRGAMRERALGVRAKHLFSSALVHLGVSNDDPKKFDEAAQLLTELIGEASTWTASGLGRLHEDLGECHRFAGRWKEGEDAYRAALAVHSHEIASVFLSECLLRQGLVGEAARVLDGVDCTHLDERERYDYACVSAALAAETKDSARIRVAIGRLKGVKAQAPYFETRKLALLLHLQEALADTSKSGNWLDAIQQLLKAPMRAFSRYAIVQPTVFGVGVDLKAMIIDAASSENDEKP
ncbi:tetratricopeptide repeat protein [Vitreimonas sp.]|uniref:tetratricopeptide repeat protein n=1 Tax=Vitreimonas sp. TaxID=3069702 RepID=UPI002ED78994